MALRLSSWGQECAGGLVLWIEGLCVGFACCMALDGIDGSV